MDAIALLKADRDIQPGKAVARLVLGAIDMAKDVIDHVSA